MRIHLINLDGSRIDRNDLVRRGIIEPGLDYTAGAIGCSLSHIGLWQHAIETEQPLTLCEDDAVFNHDFERQAEALIASLPEDWHFVLWGWNFDTPALFDIAAGALPFQVHFEQDQMRERIARFQIAPVTPRPFRLLVSFGTPCYTISPEGARRLQQLCVPIQAAPVFVPLIQRLYPNKDISCSLLAAYAQINAFASFPPLVVTRNDHATSTVLAPPHRSPLARP